LRPERVLLTYDNIRSLALGTTEVAARVATEDEVLAAHDREFLEAVKGIDAGTIDEREGFAFGLGTGDNPIFDGMHAASLAVCGASLTALEQVLEGAALHSFNPAGGLHHARRREASGFCIYNDPAVAIAKALDVHPDWRVMYLDVDVHHGDGVQWIFYDDPRVLTLSFHQSGRYLYPGTGFENETGGPNAAGTSANLPLLPQTGNADYLWALERMLPALAEAFRPQLLVTQLGADTHWNDPLANLGLTMAAYPPMAKLIHQTAHDFCEGRWVATGGGGYQFDTVVPKVWTMHFAEMCDSPEVIPSGWFEDRDPDDVSSPYRDGIERSVDEVLGACLPRLESFAV
jgi:acetoin utilization protein AcuC